MQGAQIHYPAVFVAAAVHMAIGFLWYSPIGFAKIWMAAVGKTEADMKEACKRGGLWKTYGIYFSALLLLSTVLAYFIDYTGADSMADGIGVGAWAWLGFVATTSLGGVLFEKRPFRLYLINGGYALVGMVISGAILASWR
ncbi:MAG: DUF1761 domain-containing protein [Candidatus Omnitrophica bacterium]|nr:DUF1761 domain-containing protein [Candidatus Omnitrophota bacterium]